RVNVRFPGMSIGAWPLPLKFTRENLAALYERQLRLRISTAPIFQSAIPNSFARMELHTAIELIKPGITPVQNARWADLGCGQGLFTRALAQIIGKESTIYAVDANSHALN